MKKISVVLAYYNRRQYLTYALNSLVRQTHKPYEIIVVDDDSDQEGEYILNGYASHFLDISMRYVRIKKEKPEYRTSVFAMNEGIFQSFGDIVVLSSAETIHGPHNLRRVFNLLRKNPNSFVFSQRFYFQQRYAYIPEFVKWNPSDIATCENVVTWKKGHVAGDGEITRQDNMVTGIICGTKDNFYKLNGFDEEKTEWGANDYDFNRRAKLAKIELVFDQRIWGIHQWHKRNDFDVKKSQNQRAKSRSNRSYFVKHGIDSR